MIVKNWMRVVLVQVIAVAIMVIAPAAQAGFEWAPSPVKKNAPPVLAVPASVVEVENLDNQVLPIKSSPMPQYVEEKIEAPIFAPTYESEEMLVAPISYSDAIGFGNGIPLVLVMSHIVPPEFSYSFDTNVNMGSRVSWNGGKPWDEVLDDALAALDMSAEIVGKAVLVRVSHGISVEKIRASESHVLLEPVMAMAPVVFSPFDPAPMPDSMVPVPAAPEVPSVQSYPRRNPIPFMMKQGERSNNILSEPSEPDLVVLAPTPLVASPFSDILEPAVPVMATQPPSPVTNMKPIGVGVMDPFEIRFWHAEQGTSLNETLGNWSGISGVKMFWNLASDYTLPLPVRMHGTFPDAVTHILTTYGDVDPRPLGRLHPNLPNGPSILVIENYSSVTN